MKFDGAKLKAIRSEHGLTMVDLVAKLSMPNQSYISQIEKAREIRALIFQKGSPRFSAYLKVISIL